MGNFVRKNWAVLLVLGLVVFFSWPVLSGQAKLRQVPAGALVVDVRTPGEFASGHYAGAVNIPLSDLGGRLSELGSKDSTVVVYCRSGSRSAVAKRLLDERGFKRVIDGGGLRQMGL